MNLGRIAEFYGADGVLIDTWWNVNADCKISFRGAKDSFNRYMVECEWVNSHFTGHGNGF